MKKHALFVLALALSCASGVEARDIRFSGALTQGEFRDLSREAGAAISYKNTAPAEPLGLAGFDAGAEVTIADIKKESSYWNKAFGGDPPRYLYLPKIRVRKGLPLGIDVGAMYSYVPDTNVKLYGFELSKAILEGSAATPAVGVRATYTRIAGVDDLSLQTAGMDASISKGFLFITPYAGAGALWIGSKATGHLQDISGLRKENIWQPRFFGGVKISPLPFIGITAEAEYQVRPLYSVKAAVSF